MISERRIKDLRQLYTDGVVASLAQTTSLISGESYWRGSTISVSNMSESPVIRLTPIIHYSGPEFQYELRMIENSSRHWWYYKTLISHKLSPTGGKARRLVCHDMAIKLPPNRYNISLIFKYTGEFRRRPKIANTSVLLIRTGNDHDLQEPQWLADLLRKSGEISET